METIQQSKDYLTIDDAVLAPCQQSALPETEGEEEKSKRQRTEVFVPPTVEEVRNYATEMEYPQLDATGFVASYEQNKPNRAEGEG